MTPEQSDPQQQIFGENAGCVDAGTLAFASGAGAPKNHYFYRYIWLEPNKTITFTVFLELQALEPKKGAARLAAG